MPKMSLASAIGWLADQDPDRPALTDPTRTLTRRDVDRESNALARAYADRGVGQDDLVQISLPNGVEFYLACAATWKLGAIPQPLSWRLPEIERGVLRELVDPALVVGGPDIGDQRPYLPAGFCPEADTSTDPLPDRVSSSWKAPTSGGSTGTPKIIFSGDPGLVDPTVAGVDFMPRDGVQLVPGPLFHNGPFIYSMRGLLSGHSLVIMPRFDAEQVLALVQEHRVSWMMLVPTMMHRIWRLPTEIRESYDLSSLVGILHLAAPCPPWLKEAWIDWLGPERVFEIYAGTESQGITVIDGADWLTHRGSVGRPTRGSRFRILDPDGRDCGVGVVGEVFMMPADGPGSTYRYLGAEPRSIEGWESLGDLGSLDAEGYLYLSDRRVDLILTGGQNVYPAEVEAALDTHPDVRSSAVIGLPDEDLGQRVHAVVDVGPAQIDAAELIAHVAERLVRYKVPRTLEIVHEPLRTDDGKLRRHALRAARS